MSDKKTFNKQCICGNSYQNKFKRYYFENEFLGLLCDECHTEWLNKEFVYTSANTLSVPGHTLHQRDPQSADEQDYSITFQVKATRTEIPNVKYAEECLKPGDHIAWHRPYVIWHHAVLLDIKETKATVVHFTKHPEYGCIHVAKQEVNLEKELGILYRIDYSDNICKENPVELVIARAHAMIGKREYKLFKQNCEDIATFCKIGIQKSQQTSWFFNKIRKSLGTTLTKTGAQVVEYSTVITSVVMEEFALTSARMAAAEAFERVAQAAGWAGPVLIAGTEIGFCIFDLNKMYKERKSGKLSRNDFMKECWQRVTEGFLSASLTVLGALGGELAGIALGGTVGNLIVPGIGGLIGGLVGGVIGAIIGGSSGNIIGKTMGTAIGQHIGLAFTKRFRADDKAVTGVHELQPGDHIVFFRTAVHPRCHAIVVDIKEDEQKVLVIRNKYKGGVVEQWMAFSPPVYNVHWPKALCRPPEEVLQVAREKIGQNTYTIWRNNCKHFAQFCKIGFKYESDIPKSTKSITN